MTERTSAAVFLQVRLDSSRLPRKALLPLAGMTVIEQVMESLLPIPAAHHVLLTDEASLAELQPLAAAHGFAVFCGPKEDVLARFALALGSFPAASVIRATGDNPLVSARLARELLRLHETNGAHYSAFDGPPLGTGVEIVDSAALLGAAAGAVDPYEREHVSPFLYRNPGRFRLQRVCAEERYRLSAARVTIDTERDYRFITELYRELYRGEPIDILELIAWLRMRVGAVEGIHPGT